MKIISSILVIALSAALSAQAVPTKHQYKQVTGDAIETGEEISVNPQPQYSYSQYSHVNPENRFTAVDPGPSTPAPVPQPMEGMQREMTQFNSGAIPKEMHCVRCKQNVVTYVSDRPGML